MSNDTFGRRGLLDESDYGGGYPASRGSRYMSDLQNEKLATIFSHIVHFIKLEKKIISFQDFFVFREKNF